METNNQENKKRKIISKKLILILAFFIVVCIGAGFGLYQYNQNNAVDSIIGFDVNPSIELKTNKKEKIIEAVALNEAGETVLKDMDLKDTDLDVAVNAIIGSMLKNGYISTDSNSILVSVQNDDVEKGNKLQEELSKEIEELLKASSIDGSVLSQSYEANDEIKKLAEENSVSEGKAKLINQILKSEVKDTKGNVITFDALSKLSINELNLLLTSKQTKVEEVKTTGNASEDSYIGKEKAKELALKQAKLTAKDVSRIDVEIDYDDGKLVYELDFRNGNIEYDYEIDAKTGEFVQTERESDGSEGDSNYDDTDYGTDNDGVTEYGNSKYDDTDYGPNNDGVTDYDDGDSSYSKQTTTNKTTNKTTTNKTTTNKTTTNKTTTNKTTTKKPSSSSNNSNYDDGNSGYSDSGYDDSGNSGYDDSGNSEYDD